MAQASYNRARNSAGNGQVKAAVLVAEPPIAGGHLQGSTTMRKGRVLISTMLLAAMLGASACTKHMGVGAGIGAASGAGLGALSGGSILGGAATGAALGAGGGYVYDKLKH